jgi:hypothetical protein
MRGTARTVGTACVCSTMRSRPVRKPGAASASQPARSASAAERRALSTERVAWRGAASAMGWRGRRAEGPPTGVRASPSAKRGGAGRTGRGGGSRAQGRGVWSEGTEEPRWLAWVARLWKRAEGHVPGPSGRRRRVLLGRGRCAVAAGCAGAASCTLHLKSSHDLLHRGRLRDRGLRRRGCWAGAGPGVQA